ncbi:MAG: primosomal protein N' [Anaerolineales bacterium]|jgi:primosomal protein N' (replication factor Y)
MPVYVEVAVNVPRVSGVFHYHLPPELEGEVQPGDLVTTPFGKQTVQGVVLREVSEPEVAETKAIESILDREVSLPPYQLALAEQMSTDTLAPLAACIGLMLPTGLSQQADTLYTLLEGERAEGRKLEEMEVRLVGLLKKRGPLRGRQIDRALPRRNWRTAARSLVDKKWIGSQAVLPPPRVRPKYIRTAQLSVPPEIARAKMEGLGQRKNTQARRQKILSFLLDKSEPVDVDWVYAQINRRSLDDLKALNDLGLIMLREEEAWRDPLAGLSYDPSFPPILTNDQEAAWTQIKQGIERAFKGEAVPPYLLHGVTGSGKTEIYLKAVAEVLKGGKQAVVLVPEIALTPQTVQRFMSRFHGRVGLVHSRLSPGERYDTWRRARIGTLSVIIGPRSALFTPTPDLGLIVVDESHDQSYYQSMQAPSYHARETAISLAKITGAVCIFGSATPDITSYYQAQKGRWQLLELPARILAHKETVRVYTERLGKTAQYKPAGEEVEMAELPPVEVVDMREELKGGNRSIFSRSLQDSIAKVLEKEQQAILFLNRRGTATYVFCRDCGQALRCPRCDMNLTYHSNMRYRKDSKTALICHQCGYRRQLPKTCPACGSERIRHYGMGTQRVEAEIQAMYPEARTLRWDHETTRQKGAHEIILSHFSHHRADILIGTQMLAKGLDLPLVTLVGVVLADVGLHLPDYRAGERVFQVLAQVAGRAGRSPLGGEVILQTFNPEHYVIQAAAGHDYAGFVEKEYTYREQLGYPPFARLVRMEYRHYQEDKAEEEAQHMAKQLKAWIKAEDRRATEIIGPAPCFYSRLEGRYRWQIILRGPDPASLLLDRKLGDWRVEVNPQALL